MWDKVFFVVLTILLSLAAPPIQSSPDSSSQISYLIAFSLALLVHLMKKGELSNWFRVDVIFLIGFVTVNFQWCIITLFGYDLGNYTNYVIDYNSQNFSVWLSSLGGVAWFLGNSLVSKPSQRLNHMLPVHNGHRVKSLSVVCFILFVLFAGSDFLSGAVYREGAGYQSYGGGWSAYLQLVYSVSILVYTAIIFLEFREDVPFYRYLIRRQKVYLVLASTYIMLFLSIGDRGGPIQLVLALILGYSSRIRGLKPLQSLTLIVGGGLLLTAVALGRGESSTLSSGLSKLDFSKGAFTITMNLADSNRVTNAAVSHVAQNDIYRGRLMIGNILGIIPFAQSFYLTVTDAEKHTLSTSSFFTYLRYGDNAPSGEGTTIIADLFINFGAIGTYLGMLVFGVFLGLAEKHLSRNTSVTKTCLAVVVVSSTLYFGRANVLWSLKFIVYAVLILKALDINSRSQ